VVGTSGAGGFVWAPSLGLSALASGPGVIKLTPSAINDVDLIVGSGVHNGQAEAFLLTP
jgi:hypothetical protein